MSEGVVREDAGKVSAEGFIVPTIGGLEQVLYFTTAPSVTAKAKQVLDQGRLRVPGAVVVWDESLGRRTGTKAVPRSWWAGTGSLTVTFALPHRADLDEQERLNRAAAATLRVATSFRPRVPPAFRPPNDLLIEDLKMGAVSFEAYSGVDLVTVRLNCCPELQKAPPPISARAARLIDFIDVGQLPLQREGTLPNTFLSRLVAEIPNDFDVR